MAVNGFNGRAQLTDRLRWASPALKWCLHLGVFGGQRSARRWGFGINADRTSPAARAPWRVPDHHFHAQTMRLISPAGHTG